MNAIHSIYYKPYDCNIHKYFLFNLTTYEFVAVYYCAKEEACRAKSQR